MGVSILTTRYAEAFVDAAGDKAESLLDELVTLRELFADSDPLRQLLTSPVIRAEDRSKGLRLVSEKLQLADLVKRVLELMVENGRGNLVPELAEAAAAVVDNRLGRKYLQITTARSWDEEERKALLNKLQAGNARIDWQVDQALLGGVRVQSDDLVWDGSVHKQLNRLQEILTR